MCQPKVLFFTCSILVLLFQPANSSLFVTQLTYAEETFNYSTTHEQPSLFATSASLNSNTRGFKAKLKVGSNRVEQDLYVDTGSSLLWINCEPLSTQTRNIPDPIFDPSSSSTLLEDKYRFSLYCHHYNLGNVLTLPYTKGRCGYKISYGSGITSKGYLAKEMFYFNEDSHRLVFGCSHYTNLNQNGILGLGYNAHLSLLAQTATSRFAYCLGDINDPYYNFSKLLIGDDIKPLDYKTPMTIAQRYYINLESIIFNGYKLNIDPSIFSGGMVIDSGSTLSFLPSVAVTTLRSAIREMVKDYDDDYMLDDYSLFWNGSTNGYIERRLCFTGNLENYLSFFFPITLRFANQADFKLYPHNYLVQINNGVFCDAVIASEAIGAEFSILGAIMQQSNYIVFDVNSKMVSFENKDCNTMDSYIHDELKYNT